MDVSDSAFDDAVEALRAGRPVLFPTDTVCGLGVSVRHAATPDILFTLKHRERSKPIAWLVGGAEDLDKYGADVPALAKDLARVFWPGPLTLVVKASKKVPLAFQSEAGTIGLRMPGNKTALGLIRAVGCPLATTSANITGRPSPRTVDDIDNDLVRAVGVVLDDGQEKSGVASTVLDCTGDHPLMLRCGAISAADIAAHS